MVEEQIQEERKITEDFGDSTIGRLRKKCWNLTEYPETSLSAKVCDHIVIISPEVSLKLYAFFSLFVVVLSTLIFILTTQPGNKPELTDELLDLIRTG